MRKLRRGCARETSFAGFPRVCWLLALDRYLPVAFVHRGRRLAYSRGILLLSVLAGLLIVASDAITDRLIPLFAIGALLAFTLSQTGMVVYWTRRRDEGWRWRRVLNGVGALLTGLALSIVIVAKFTHGGWAAVVIIPLGVLLFSRVHRAYLRVRETTGLLRPMALEPGGSMVAVVPMSRWSHASETALRFAWGPATTCARCTCDHQCALVPTHRGPGPARLRPGALRGVRATRSRVSRAASSRPDWNCCRALSPKISV